MYLSASAFDEATKKEQSKVKELEDKYNEKIVEHSVSVYIIGLRRFYRTMQFRLVQSAVLQSHVVRLSVRPSNPPMSQTSVTLVDCDHIGWKSWQGSRIRVR